LSGIRRITGVWTKFGRRPSPLCKTLSVWNLSIGSRFSCFECIGVKYGKKTLWKIYANASCKAIIDNKRESAGLIHDALGNLTGVVSSQGTLWNSQDFSPYGSLNPAPLVEPDLLTFAQSFSWQGKRADPTGYVWIGARYYDPTSGRCLSPDPIGYPFCLDLYAYANGDPINYTDPDGRYATAAYQTLQSVTIDLFNSHQFQGSLQAIGGAAQDRMPRKSWKQAKNF
jgi:RHS repeat-associated protein